MRKSIAVALIAASTAASGCSYNRSESGGPTVSRNYQVGNFEQLEVAGAYDVDVRTGANPSVSATGPQKLLDRTVVEVRGDKLVIRPKEQGGFFHFGWSDHGKAHVTVTVPQLTDATIAGSGEIRLDKATGNRFEGTVAGSGDLAVANVDVQNLKLSIAGSGDAKAGAGKTQFAEYSIAGSGGVDGGSVTAQQAKVSIAGSGSIKAHATGTADVEIMGSGDVDVSGGAKCNVEKHGSGDVRCS